MTITYQIKCEVSEDLNTTFSSISEFNTAMWQLASKLSSRTVAPETLLTIEADFDTANDPVKWIEARLSVLLNITPESIAAYLNIMELMTAHQKFMLFVLVEKKLYFPAIGKENLFNIEARMAGLVENFGFSKKDKPAGAKSYSIWGTHFYYTLKK